MAIGLTCCEGGRVMGAPKLAPALDDDLGEAQELVEAAIDNVDRLIGRAVAILAEDGSVDTARQLHKIASLSYELTNNLEGALASLRRKARA